eukprot:tig00001056_g6634.t1
MVRAAGSQGSLPLPPEDIALAALLVAVLPGAAPPPPEPEADSGSEGDSEGRAGDAGAVEAAPAGAREGRGRAARAPLEALREELTCEARPPAPLSYFFPAHFHLSIYRLLASSRLVCREHVAALSRCPVCRRPFAQERARSNFKLRAVAEAFRALELAEPPGGGGGAPEGSASPAPRAPPREE